MRPRSAHGAVILFAALILTVAAMNGGCVRYETGSVEVGRPISAGDVRQIEIGKTTRSDVFKLLGTPHSIFEGTAQFLENRSMTFYSHSANRYLTSINPWHYAMLYRFARDAYSHRFMVVSGRTSVQIKTDELLLLVNKDTNVVEDLAYRPETGS